MRHGQCCTQLNNPLRALCFGTLEWLFSQCACGMHFAEMEAALAACLLSCPACSDDVEQLQELLVILTSSVVSKAWLSLQTSHLRVAVCHAIFQLLLKLPLDLPSHWCTTHVSLLCDGLLQAYHPVALTKVSGKSSLYSFSNAMYLYQEYITPPPPPQSVQLLIPFRWGTPMAKTYITWCSVAVVRFQSVLASSGVIKKALSDRNSLLVCKSPA